MHHVSTDRLRARRASNSRSLLLCRRTRGLSKSSKVGAVKVWCTAEHDSSVPAHAAACSDVHWHDFVLIELQSDACVV